VINKNFADFEQTLADFFFITEQSVNKIRRGSEIGIIKGKLNFNEGSLEFIEVVKFESEQPEKVKYSYHYMDANKNLVFRYDNARHHKEISTYPHHKHIEDKVFSSREPDIFQILKEIQKNIKRK